MFSALTGWSVRGKATDANPPTPLPATTLLQEDYSPPEFNIDEYRPLKVRCIGAGFSGIICALRSVTYYTDIVSTPLIVALLEHRFRQKIPNLDFKVYEKQAGVGGTWYANRYPVSRHKLLWPFMTRTKTPFNLHSRVWRAMCLVIVYVLSQYIAI